MFERLGPDENNIIAFKAVGRLTDADYQAFMPQIETVIAKHGRARLLVDLSRFEGWELQAAWDDFAFGIKHWSDFERMALIGDKTWEAWAARIADKLMPGCQTRLFATDEGDAAWAWIRG